MDVTNDSLHGIESYILLSRPADRFAFINLYGQLEKVDTYYHNNLKTKNVIGTSCL